MSSHMQRELEAERPEWYRLVLACLRGEVPLADVPEERRWMCVEHRRFWRIPHAAAVRQAEDILEGRDGRPTTSP